MATYNELKLAIFSGAIKSFDDFLQHMKTDNFIKDTGISPRRLAIIEIYPLDISLEELLSISDLLSIEPEMLIKIFKMGQVRQ